MNKTISVADLKSNTDKILSEVKLTGGTVPVVEHSKLKAVIIDPLNYEKFIQAQEDLEDLQSLRDLDPNEPNISHEELGKKLKLF